MFLSECREFPLAPCLAGKKKIWWQFASRCCWNRAHPLHASELVSFLYGLRTYQHPGYIAISTEQVGTVEACKNLFKNKIFVIKFLKILQQFPRLLQFWDLFILWGIVRSVKWRILIDLSGQTIGPIPNGQVQSATVHLDNRLIYPLFCTVIISRKPRRRASTL